MNPTTLAAAEDILTALRTAGATPREGALTLHLALYYLAKHNSLSLEQALNAFAHDWAEAARTVHLHPRIITQ